MKQSLFFSALDILHKFVKENTTIDSFWRPDFI